MARDTPYYTFDDAYQHVADFAGTDSGDRTARQIKRAVASAYRVLPRSHPWTYYRRTGRIISSEPYDTGTIAYDHTGGAYERLVTLTTGTWPTWAAYAILMVDNVPYRVVSRVSSTQILLDEFVNPGADIASLTEYALYQDVYTLPADFSWAGAFGETESFLGLDYLSPEEWMSMIRTFSTGGRPGCYTFIRDQASLNRIAVAFTSFPMEVVNYDFVYHAAPLPLRIQSESTGTVVSSGTAITGTTTAFTQRHVGAIIRFGDSSNVPTGADGIYPFAEERIITKVTDSTHLTLNAALTTEVSGVKFLISDVIDIDTAVMQTPFERLAELTYAMQLQRDKTRADITLRQGLYDSAYRMATGMDYRDVTETSVAGGSQRDWSISLRDIRDYSTF